MALCPRANSYLSFRSQPKGHFFMEALPYLFVTGSFPKPFFIISPGARDHACLNLHFIPANVWHKADAQQILGIRAQVGLMYCSTDLTRSLCSIISKMQPGHYVILLT